MVREQDKIDGLSMKRYAALLGFLLAASHPVHAAEGPLIISGPAIVTDGDTLRIDGQRVRLFGIDAPEKKQSCMKDNRSWRCGIIAAEALRELIGEKKVRCESRSKSSYGRIVATCHLDGQDVAAWMTASGYALAYRSYSLDYVDEEDEARVAGKGVWAGAFEPPWEFRKKQRHHR
jgi:endonuclease YncB( thermonuclease family)